MAVPEQTPYKEYVGNGVTTNFALGFTCDLKQELKVFINDVEPELSTWSLTSGSVSFTTAPALGSKIAFKRATKLERTTNYLSSNNSFRPEAINKDFDRVWYAIQDQNYKVGQYDYDYNFILTQVRPVNAGGTGADNVVDARTNLGVYSQSEVDSLIATGGAGSVVGIAGGGTGATTAEQARENLSVYSKSETNTAITEATPAASETVAGVVRLTNNLTSTDTDKALTAAQGKVLNDQAFGVGQSWVNVRSTRLVNTLYTNDTNKPISVSIANPNVYWNEFSIVVGGVVIQSSVNNYQLPISIIFNVPVGATYRVNSGAFGITGGVTAVWAELR